MLKLFRASYSYTRVCLFFIGNPLHLIRFYKKRFFHFFDDFLKSKNYCQEFILGKISSKYFSFCKKRVKKLSLYTILWWWRKIKMPTYFVYYLLGRLYGLDDRVLNKQKCSISLEPITMFSKSPFKPL